MRFVLIDVTLTWLITRSRECESRMSRGAECSSILPAYSAEFGEERERCDENPAQDVCLSSSFTGNFCDVPYSRFFFLFLFKKYNIVQGITPWLLSLTPPPPSVKCTTVTLSSCLDFLSARMRGKKMVNTTVQPSHLKCVDEHENTYEYACIHNMHIYIYMHIYINIYIYIMNIHIRYIHVHA